MSGPVLEAICLRSGALLAALGRASGPLGAAVLGDPKREKSSGSSMGKPLFENRFFHFLELLMALLGLSWRLLGRSGSQTGPQNGPQEKPKSVPKLVKESS